MQLDTGAGDYQFASKLTLCEWLQDGFHLSMCELLGQVTDVEPVLALRCQHAHLYPQYG